jgi:hypothetical protein
MANYKFTTPIIAEGHEVYRGGYEHIVDDATKSALIAGGVGITEEDWRTNEEGCC